jgi:hypothetical protein
MTLSAIKLLKYARPAARVLLNPISTLKTQAIKWAQRVAPKTTARISSALAKSKLAAGVNKYSWLVADRALQVWTAWSILLSMIKAAQDPNAKKPTGTGVQVGDTTLPQSGWAGVWAGRWAGAWVGKGIAWASKSIGWTTLQNLLWDAWGMSGLDTTWWVSELDWIKWLWLVDVIIKKRWKTKVENLKTDYDRWLTKRETGIWVR